MAARKSLITLFVVILAVMIGVTSWATMVQPIWEWGGLATRPDNAWTIATLADAYCGFLTFFVWVCFKERRSARRIAWFVGIMALGNMAMAAYMLMELKRLRRDDPVELLLTRRNG